MAKKYNRDIVENLIERNVIPLIYIIVFAFVVSITIFITKQFFPNKADLLNIANAAILFFTGEVLVVYTYETYRLRKASNDQIREIQKQIEVSQQQIHIAHKQVEETQRQTEIQLRPFVVLDVECARDTHDGGKRYYIAVKNVGNGTAINVIVKDTTENTQVPYSFPQNPICILSPNERYPIEYKRITVDRQERGTGIVCFDKEPYNLYPPDARETTIITIEFMNVEGQAYFVKESISPQSLEINSAKRVDKI